MLAPRPRALLPGLLVVLMVLGCHLASGQQRYRLTNNLLQKPDQDQRVNTSMVYVPDPAQLKEWEHATAGWQPKLQGTPQGDAYDPRNVDWVSVISACSALIRFEKRFGGFFTRSAFHDALAVNTQDCLGPQDARSIGCGGADGSLFLTREELLRPENQQDQFAPLAGQAIVKFASWYDASVADTLAVCAAVAPSVLTNGTRVSIINAETDMPFLVGRLDSLTPADAGNLLGALPPAFANVEDLDAFWRRRGLTPEEGWALLGAHALIDEQRCFVGPTSSDYCMETATNPTDPASCTNVRMFKWENHYYHDTCTLTMDVTPIPPEQPDPLETPILGMDDAEFEAEVRQDTCTFSSAFFRNRTITQLQQVRRGEIPDPELRPLEPFHVRWSNEFCPLSGAVTGARFNCPHPTLWFYTTADAFAAEACQATAPELPEPQAIARASYRRYLNQPDWDVAYIRAYKKMTNIAVFADSAPGGLAITGSECPGGYVADARWCPNEALTSGPAAFDVCSNCTTGVGCHSCCRCRTLFADGMATRLPDVTQLMLQGIFDQPPPAPPPPAPLPVPLNSLPASFLQAAPYAGNPGDVCPTLGNRVIVDGYPSSPFPWQPFQRQFVRPPRLQPSTRECRADGSHCVQAYEIDVFSAAANLTCPGPLTKLLTYGGTSPGPTIAITKGTEALVRFNNKIRDDGSGLQMFVSHPPCSTTPGLVGRPIAVHHHGSASLAPYDGWAEDSVCTDQTKDYILPASRTATHWYHDHQIEITSENAYFGLAGFYLVSDRVVEGGCGLPFNLDTVPETEMMLNDKVFDENCQLFYDRNSFHRNNLYGDMILVSGTPWPVMTFAPTWHRMLLLNAGPVRPYKLRIITGEGLDWSARPGVCYVVAGDGGFKQTPTPFPVEGLFIGVAERYEVVCNLEVAAGQQLYLVNVKDDERMPNVPFFCFSHLVARLDVLTADGQLPEGVQGGVPTEVLGGGEAPEAPVVEAPDVEAPEVEEAEEPEVEEPEAPEVEEPEVAEPAALRVRNRRLLTSGKTRVPLATATASLPTDAIADAVPPLYSTPTTGAGAPPPPSSLPPTYAAGAPPPPTTTVADAPPPPTTTTPATQLPPPITIAAAPPPPPPSSTTPRPQFFLSVGVPTGVDAVINDDVFEQATQMAINRNCTRNFRFGRRRGHWVINGEDWHSMRIAAGDVGQNTWEVWCMRGGGGWFHPIHVHLVDFYVIARNQDPAQVYSYEQRTPKDVVQLDPSAEVAILARFGPHRGDYMFHCHNLVHEDNEMLRAFSVVEYENALMPSGDFAIGLSMVADVVYDRYKDPLYPPAAAKPTAFTPPVDFAARSAIVDNLYRLFYPRPTDAAVLQSPATNPWLVQTCPTVPQR